MGKHVESYEISAALEDKCYWCIKISAEATLEQLSSVILQMFDLNEDYMHAFFMTNRAWDDEGNYFAKGMGLDACLTCDYKLSELGLYRKKKFLYLFDIGKELRFHCAVVRELKEQIIEPLLIRSEGELPKSSSI